LSFIARQKSGRKPANSKEEAGAERARSSPVGENEKTTPAPGRDSAPGADAQRTEKLPSALQVTAGGESGAGETGAV
jgi:hypothetical protein